jgi:hypothetical protein
MPTEPVTLPAHCAHCGKTVTLQMSAWPVSLHPAPEHAATPPPDREQTWGCPWCHWENTGRFHDRLDWAARVRREPKGPD